MDLTMYIGRIVYVLSDMTDLSWSVNDSGESVDVTVRKDKQVLAHTSIAKETGTTAALVRLNDFIDNVRSLTEVKHQ